MEDITAAARTVDMYAGPRGIGSKVSTSWVPDYPPVSQNLPRSEGVPADDREPRLPMEV